VRFHHLDIVSTDEDGGTDAPTLELSEDAEGFITESDFLTNDDALTEPPTDALGFTAAEAEAQEAQDNDAAIQELIDNQEPEDAFSAALLFTDVPSDVFTSGDSIDLVTYEINTKVVMDIGIGWKSGII
jgi:hypothetical protein